MSYNIDEATTQTILDKYLTHNEYPSDIAKQYGISKKSVINILKKAGVTIRTANDWVTIKWGTVEERELRRKQKITNKHNRRLQEGRELIKEHLAKGCMDCNEKDPIVLEFDHIDPASKEADISKLLGSHKSIERLRREIAKCEVVCANCHRRRTAKVFGSWRSLL